MITNEHLMQTSEYLDKIVMDKWLSEQFLSPVWIGIFFFVVFTYVLFFYLADKKRLVEILLFGSLVAVAFSIYDSIGELIGLWATFFRMVPLQQNFFMSDLTIIPLYAMLVYQYTKSWKTFFIGTVVWAGLIAFVFYYLILNRLNVFIYLSPIGPYLDFVFLILTGLIARGILVVLLNIAIQQGNLAPKALLARLIAAPALKHSSDNSDDDNRKS
ncbi:MAG: hypothetical protein K0S76_3287 [Herbinix sp.]|nr:hypothetical protein [Herbinix sp.]MDF2929604.1 hypothetical protein [Anaerospora sp.]